MPADRDNALRNVVHIVDLFTSPPRNYVEISRRSEI
jgi:hypothetical protein